MSDRDDLLPTVDEIRQIPTDFGIRRFAVILRRRIWSGNYVGDGTPTNDDITLTPLPKVRDAFAVGSNDPKMLEYIIAQGNVIKDRYYKINRITPFYGSGGYTATQLRMRPSPDYKNVEPVVILVGDDGFARECVQVSFEIDRAFGYSMLVQETDRPKVALISAAITPSTPTIAHATSLQLTCTGTFEGSSTSDITPLMRWSSSTPSVATVDLLGKVSALTAGTSTITASLGAITASTVVTVT